MFRANSAVVFDYSKLKGLMAEKGITQKALAVGINSSENSISKKFNGAPFSSSDIAKICNFLDIPSTQIGLYFFTVKV